MQKLEKAVLGKSGRVEGFEGGGAATLEDTLSTTCSQLIDTPGGLFSLHGSCYRRWVQPRQVLQPLVSGQCRVEESNWSNWSNPPPRSTANVSSL